MIDKDQAEINAISHVFPQSRILLCLFHVIQAWQRWLASSDVPAVCREDVLTL